MPRPKWTCCGVPKRRSPPTTITPIWTTTNCPTWPSAGSRPPTPAELATIVAKTIAYEQSANFGPWRRQLSLVAGLGGFGPLTDMLVESTARYFITQGIPESYRLDMAYASWRSPYRPDPRQFRETALESLNEGEWLWVYIGHGNPGELDRVRVPGGGFPIPGRRRDRVAVPPRRGGGLVPLVLRGGLRAPPTTAWPRVSRPAVRWPCWPARATMPYGMAGMASELMAQCFGRHPATLGDAIPRPSERWSRTRPRTTAAGRPSTASPRSRVRRRSSWPPSGRSTCCCSTCWVDPLLRLRYPQPVQLTLGSAAAAARLSVNGVSPVDGPCTVELTVPRGTLTFAPPRRDVYPQDDQSLQRFQEVYRRHNDGRLTTAATIVSGGRLETALNVPRRPAAAASCGSSFPASRTPPPAPPRWKSRNKDDG